MLTLVVPSSYIGICRNLTNMKNYKLEKLQNGETFVTSEKGNSMIPLIKPEQEHKLAPVKWEDCNEGDIVYCKVKGNFYTHLVKGKNNDKGRLLLKLCLTVTTPKDKVKP